MDLQQTNDPILAALQRGGVPCKLQERMARHTTFSIGGAARYFVCPRRETELRAALRIFSDADLPIVILGRGSNVLFSDDGFQGAVICMTGLRSLYKIEDASAAAAGQQLIFAECGVTLRELAAFAAECALSGLEFAHGIPGTVGGAIRMNAGAFGGEIGAVVDHVCCCHRQSGEIETISGDDFAFSHRHSLLSERTELVCLSAVFKLPLPPAEDDARETMRHNIHQTMEDYKQRRRSTQPLEYPSAGSIFKRPTGHYAGKLIEDCGLKGLQIGGAQVSPKHAGFIINRGGATAEDVRTLITRIKQVVNERFGVLLEEEVLYLGDER
ncbi:MAG: UDP-N-acetylmuramate dehydrogenase [Clostridia bacterium]|nr:UDP-N-acetylmuramate dehydrogenase [Clostridia bacterium]